MSSVELDHLIKMLNQIADNFASSGNEDEQAQKVAGHIKRFWAPAMIKTISDYAQNDEDKLSPVSKNALSLVNQ